MSNPKRQFIRTAGFFNYTRQAYPLAYATLDNGSYIFCRKFI